MRLLLDTHIWIWSLTESARLKPKVRAALSHRNADLWLSSISVWEALVLIRKGRLRVKDSDGSRWIGQALKRSPVREAPLTHAIAIESELLTVDHWDPADRFIAATARVLGVTLVTADERLIATGTLKVLPSYNKQPLLGQIKAFAADSGAKSRPC
jgi:PIN domain nuclease of toxin-antitoxin system